MLNLNHNPNPNPNPNSSASPTPEEVYKILILDPLTRDILSPLIHVKDLRRHGITLFFPIDKDRQVVRDVPAIYFVRPTPPNVARIVSDASRGTYDALHLNFSSSLPRPLLEDLAKGSYAADAVGRISRVYDQYLEFVTLEENLFSLAQPDVYVRMNDPSAGDGEIEGIVEGIVGGLFCVLVTLGVVPVIRCAAGGPAQMVAAALDARLRDHLVTKNNLFAESGSLVSSFQRPVLCLFDRNFELAVGLRHEWSYRPLVHDVFDMKLNRVSVRGEKSEARVYDLDDSDPFWVSNSRSPFEKIALEIDAQLNRYKQDVEEVNRRAGGQKGAEFDGADLGGNTKNLMSAVNSLPEITERKKVIDKHTNIATVLLGQIKERALDSFCSLESEIASKGSVDKHLLFSQLKDKGTKEDKLRLAIIYLLSVETTSQLELESIEAALRESEVDTCAFQYVKKIKSLNMSMNSSVASASKSHIVDWAEKLYGQSLSAVTAGMKNLLSADRELALTRIVEALMEGKPNPEVDSYLLYDPRAPRSGTGAHLKGPFKEGIVFMIGGGNYVEYGSLMELTQRSQPTKHIMYGATEILNGVDFVRQLQVLGQKMGLGNSGINPSH